MGKLCQVQAAKAGFSEFFATSLTEGPQIVTKRSVQTAVLVPIEQWRRPEQLTKPDLKQLLLAPEARRDALTPPRGNHHREFHPSTSTYKTHTWILHCPRRYDIPNMTATQPISLAQPNYPLNDELVILNLIHGRGSTCKTRRQSTTPISFFTMHITDNDNFWTGLFTH